MHPWFRAKNARGSHHRFTGASPAFPAQWFYGFLRALLGDRAFLPPSPRGNSVSGPLGPTSPSVQLDASVGASGPHDFAVRSKLRVVTRNCRPPHPVPTFVTVAIRPSFGTGRREGRSDLGRNETELFLRTGLDRPNYPEAVAENRYRQATASNTMRSAPDPRLTGRKGCTRRERVSCQRVPMRYVAGRNRKNAPRPTSPLRPAVTRRCGV
jgi:hypothetical protein